MIADLDMCGGAGCKYMPLRWIEMAMIDDLVCVVM